MGIVEKEVESNERNEATSLGHVPEDIGNDKFWTPFVFGFFFFCVFRNLCGFVRRV